VNWGFTICDLRFTSPCAPKLLRLGFATAALLFVASLTAQDFQPATDEIPPLAPPLPEIPPTFWELFGWLLWIVAPLVVIVLAGAVAALIFWPRKPPVLPAPATQARFTLAALQGRAGDGATLSRISQTLRHYLINAFWLRPEETTTTEFCTGLRANDQIGLELADAIGEFLRQCDERKFSPAPSAVPFDAAQRALELVEHAEARRMKPRASVPDRSGPPPLPPTLGTDNRQSTGALQDAAAKPTPPTA